jgi:hypothetical protein
MPRPFTDITTAKSSEPLKNGSAVFSTTNTGSVSINNLFVTNTPTISDIQSKYGNRYYNGILVQISSGQTLIGG